MTRNLILITVLMVIAMILLIVYRPPGQQAKPRPYTLSCDPPNKVYTNSRGQKICVVFLSDSVFRK